MYRWRSTAYVLTLGGLFLLQLSYISYCGSGGTTPTFRTSRWQRPREDCPAFTGYPVHVDFRSFSKDSLGNDYFNWCAAVASACMALQIRGGRIYVRHFFPGYQSRHRATLHALYRVSQRFLLPDADVIIEVSDGYVVPGYPIFRIARPVGDVTGILYPDFTFFSWPESICRERSHAYGDLLSTFEHVPSFETRNATLFWRGGVVGNPIRSVAVKLLKDVPGADVNFMQWGLVSITGANQAMGCVGLDDHCKYKYLAFLNGNTYSSRLKYELLCGSVVFASLPDWVEWWSSQLKPTDYVQIKKDWSNIVETLHQVKALPDGGAQIGARGRRFAQEKLSEQSVDCYWKLLIEKAHEYLPRRALSPRARPIEDVMLYGNDVRIGEEYVREEAR